MASKVQVARANMSGYCIWSKLPLIFSACSKWCHSGRECVIQNGKETCVCVSKCPGRTNRVCGTDEQLYKNHCELHRTACVTKKKIKIDWSNRCLQKQGIVYILDYLGPLPGAIGCRGDKWVKIFSHPITCSWNISMQ